MGKFFERIEAKRLSPNYVPIVGHDNVRYLAMGPDYRRTATKKEIRTMEEEAVRRVTSQPARKFKLSDRGVLRVGAYADIVVMNPNTVTDSGSQLDPRRYPDGIEYVIINGIPVVEKAEHTKAKPGRILYMEKP